MSKKALFVGNGDLESVDLIINKIDNKYDYIIALDGGIRHCKTLNLDVNLIIGDFDSVTKNDITGYSLIKKNTQDLTDFEFARDYCYNNFNVTKIDAICMASLSRMDHSLFNIYQVLVNLKYEIDMKLITKNHIFMSFGSGKYVIPCKMQQTISLMTFVKTFINSTENLRWNLTDHKTEEPWFSISNIAEKNFFNLDIESGSVLVIINDLD